MSSHYKNKKTWSGTEKALLGCGIGCGGLILIVIIISAVFAWWAMTPGEQVSTDRILAGDTVAAIRLEDLAKKPKAMEFLSAAIMEMQRLNQERQAQNMPKELRWLQSLQNSQGASAADFSPIVPEGVTLALRRGGDSPSLAIAANFRMYVRVVRWAIQQMAQDQSSRELRPLQTEYGELLEILDNETEDLTGVMGFYQSTFLFSNARELGTDSLARLATAPDSGELKPYLSTLYQGLGDEGWHLYAAVDGVVFADGDDTTFGEQDVLTSIETLRLGTRFKSADELVGQARVHCKTEQSVALLVLGLEFEAANWRKDLEERGFQLDITSLPQGKQLLVEWTIGGLQNGVQQWIQENNQQEYETDHPYETPPDMDQERLDEMFDRYEE